MEERRRVTEERRRDDAGDDRILRAIQIVQRRQRATMPMSVDQREITAEIYQELCRLDTGCQRTGLPSDKLLPPCRASESFRARRRCSL